MAVRKPVDEWTLILQKQAEYNKLHEMEQKNKFLQDQEDLRKGLEYQQQLRDLQRRQEQEERDREAREVSLRANWFKDQENNKRQQESMIKKQMADDLITHQNMLKQREIEEKNRILMEEQERIRVAQRNLEEEAKRRLEKKMQWQQEQQAMMQFRGYQEQQKNQAEMNQKMIDIELQRQRKEREEQKEQEYRDYYRRLNDNQLNRAKAFSQALQKKTEKDIEINQWINKNVDSYNQQLAQKEEYERQIRNMNSRSLNQTLKSQIENKEMQRQYAQEEYKRNQDEVTQRIEISRKLEQERENQKNLQKQLYREQLAMQMSMNNDLRMSQFKLSEAEKVMNKGILDEPIAGKRFQRGANEILKPQSSFTAKNLSYDENAKNFFGADNSVADVRKSREYGDRKRFNPITGVEYPPPMPNSRTSLRAGLKI